MFVRNLMNVHSRYLLDPDDGTAAAGAPIAEPPLEGAPAAAAEPEVEAEEFDLEGELTQDTFDRAYVEKLRKEAARHRTTARELEQKYQSVYEGFEDPEDVNYLVGLARKVYEDPASTAAEFEALAKRIREATGVDVTDTLEDIADDKPLTRADLERIEHEKAVERHQREIAATATELGYENGTAAYRELLYLAANDKSVGGDLRKAHEKIVADREALKKAAIEEYVKSLEQDANAFPPVSGGGGGAPAGSSTSGPPKTIRDASLSAMAKLEAMARQGGR